MRHWFCQEANYIPGTNGKYYQKCSWKANWRTQKRKLKTK
jgi:hypothetical protein